MANGRTETLLVVAPRASTGYRPWSRVLGTVMVAEKAPSAAVVTVDGVMLIAVPAKVPAKIMLMFSVLP